MGLDMYLKKRIHIGGNYEHNKITGSIQLSADSEAIQIDISKISSVDEEAAYWRKANAIHKWFVDNVQDGEDDCEEYEVSKDDLRSLLALCKEVLQKAKVVEGDKGRVVENAEEVAVILPSQGGFFFGGTEYDEWYIRQVEDTVKMIESLDLSDNWRVSYVYQSSW